MSGGDGLGVPRGFDLLADGSVLVLDVVNGRWVVEAGGETKEIELRSGQEIWDFVVGPDDVVYALTSESIEAYRLDRGEAELLATSAQPRPYVAGTPPLGGRLVEGVAGVSVLGDQSTEIGFVDRVGSPLTSGLPRASISNDRPFTIETTTDEFIIGGDGLLAPFSARALEGTVVAAAYLQNSMSVDTTVFAFDEIGTFIGGLRLDGESFASVLDGVGTDLRLSEDGLVRLEKSGVSLADGLRVVLYPYPEQVLAAAGT